MTLTQKRQATCHCWSFCRNKKYYLEENGEKLQFHRASRQRSTAACGQEETDHVVELQLVVAALNTLPTTTYRTRKG